MKNFVKPFKALSLMAMGALMLSACSKTHPTAVSPGGMSTVTGTNYNEDEGFELKEFRGQPDGPNLVFIEGGRTTLGSFEEDILYKRDNIERTVTVASFYMDETEVANVHWLEYEFYVKRDSSYDFYQTILPDTTVWASELAYNDPYVDHYYRYPGFRFHPVVGISWIQADDFCKWRTAFVNNRLAENLDDYDPAEGGRIPLESGVVLPSYRLPTEAEWEYAAQALIATQYLDEIQLWKRLYPWDGHSLRNPYGKQMGYYLANFKRGRGDYAGIAGKLNDGAMITSYIYEYPPNDYGLYNMAGNVNEWVIDVYRPLSFQDVDDLNPVRGARKGTEGYLDPSSGYDNKTKNPAAYSSMVDDDVRVYKGGSWKDVAYWLSPGTRRYLEQDSSLSTLGFRCAMIRAGSNY